jgi:hypothetical protein
MFKWIAGFVTATALFGFLREAVAPLPHQVLTTKDVVKAEQIGRRYRLRHPCAWLAAPGRPRCDWNYVTPLVYCEFCETTFAVPNTPAVARECSLSPAGVDGGYVAEMDRQN